MKEYIVITAAGEQYTIKVDQATIKELLKKGVIIKYKPKNKL